MGITQAILKLRAEYAKHYKISPAEINLGRCMDFAREIAIMGFGEDMWGHDIEFDIFWSDKIQKLVADDIIDDIYSISEFTSIHCFIFYKNKFYDSETPQGCNYADDLLCYQRNINYLFEIIEENNS